MSRLAEIPRRVRTVFLASLVAAVTGSTVSADIVSYAASRTVTYTQSSNAQPTTPEFWGFGALVITDVPNEIVSADVSFNRPPVTSYNFYQAIETLHQYFSPFYTGESAFLADYPATIYTVTADIGGGPTTGDVFLPEDLYCADIPHFTGDTYDRLQNYDTTQSFTVDINGFTPNPGTNVAYIIASVVDHSQPGAVLSITLDPSDTSFEISAGLLSPGTSYSIGISYLNVVDTPNAGFGSASSGAEFWRSTTAYFTTLEEMTPCCRGDFNNDSEFNALDIQGFVDALLMNETCP